MEPGALTLYAHGKINLCLDVIGKRLDGYHDVATVLQTIDLADRLRLTPHDKLTLNCRGTDYIEDNLILRAAELLRHQTGIRAGCAIECWKRIPVGAGLGGGSADAASTLVGLNALWRAGLTVAELTTLAASLGSDVPFFLRGGTSLATGTGTVIQPLPDAPRHWLLLIPIEAEIAAKTQSMYRARLEQDFASGERARKQAQSIMHGRVSYTDIGSSFARLAAERLPTVRSAIEAIARSAPLAVSVSGAGPSVFALYASRAEARSARKWVGVPSEVHRFVPVGAAGGVGILARESKTKNGNVELT